jgi:hypothetical protein
MKPYKNHRPTGFDRAGAFLDEDRQEWLVVNVSRNRDSDCLAESNFQTFLEGLGGESDNVEVHRFGHWACGWYEIILIDAKAEDIVALAQEMEDALENYPVLDEQDLSKRENEAEQESWESWARRDFSSDLKRKVESDWDGTSEHGYQPEEIDDGFDLLTEENIDCLWSNAADKANWICQHDSGGPSFNIEGVLEHINIDEVVKMIDAHLWKKHVDRDIRKLCSWLGLSNLADQAVAMNLVLVSQIRSLNQPSLSSQV